MLKFVDLSHPLIHGQAAFASDPKLSIIPHGTTSTLKYNISQIVMGSHQGTHLDAMYHFLDDGKTIDRMPLEWFYGDAVLLRIPKEKGETIEADDFRPFEAFLHPESKIIFETGWHRHFNQPDYFTDFPSLSQEAGRYLVQRGIRLLGMDLPTPSRDWYEIHHDILLPAEIVIVESLTNLDRVPDRFTFIGFPLLFQGGDGSPIRAVAVFEQ